VFEIIKRLRSYWRSDWGNEFQKQLQGPITIQCGLCEEHIDTGDVRYICAHWVDKHKEFYVLGELSASVHEGVLRSAPVVCHGVFIVRRPDYQKYMPYFNMEILNAYYFAFALVRLKQQNPHLRFTKESQVGVGPTGLLKVQNIFVEWDKE
jgi:hypothetical protein